jgi:DNA processing protein
LPRSQARLSHRQRLAWLRLIRSENVGPATFRALVNEFGGPEAAIDALPALSRRGGRIHDIRLCSQDEAEGELAAAESMGASLVVIGEPGYPPALAQVDAPPPLLYVKGRLELAEIPIVAIVGARNGSAVGQKFTRSLATDLGDEGFVIASGLARGIDTAAHLARLSEAQLPCLLAASTISIRRKTKSCIGRSTSKAFSSASERHASRRTAGNSRAGTASSPGSRSAWWWSRPPSAQGL